MEDNKKEKVQQGKAGKKKTYIVPVISFLIGVGIGVGGLVILEKTSNIFEKSVGEFMFIYAGFMVGIYFAVILDTIIHELGHMIFGLMTGWSFSSFRIGSLVLIKEKGKFKIKKMSIAGLAGQCLMNPPDLVDGKMPYKLYNFGGSIMNMITALIFGGLFFVFEDYKYVSYFFIIAGLFGVFSALTNGIPLRIGGIDNDGYNAVSMGKCEGAIRSLWVQTKVNAELVKGKRVEDMPDEWFYFPDENEMNNTLCSVTAVFYAERLIGQHKFEEAKECLDKIMNMETGLLPMHKNLVIFDRIFCELVGECDKEFIENLLTDELITFMKKMEQLPAMIRIEYALALMIDEDREKAEKLKKMFEKRAKSYPYSGDIESERELIAVIDEMVNIAQKLNKAN